MIDMEMLDAIKGLLEAQAAETKQGIDSIKGLLEAQTTELKQEIVRLDSKMDTLDGKMDTLSKKMETGFAATRSEIVDAVEAVGKQVDHLERSIKDVETVTAQNAFDVQLLRRKA